MKGARPLDNAEILLVAQQFSGTFAVRNRALFMLGVSVGGRISELLALTIGDVWQNGKPVKDLLFQRRVVKGKQLSRMVPVNADGRTAIAALIAWHTQQDSNLDPDRPLFLSRQGGGVISRGQAHKILEAAFTRAGLNGKLATHSLRKSFAQRAYDQSGDIYLVQEMLGHQSVETTREYLGVSYQKMQQTVEQMETFRGGQECNSFGVLYHSTTTNQTHLGKIPNDSLLLEAIKRGLISPEQVTQPKSQQQSAAPDPKIIKLRR